MIYNEMMGPLVYEVGSIVVVPEPSLGALLLPGLAVAGFLRKRKK